MHLFATLSRLIGRKTPAEALADELRRSEYFLRKTQEVARLGSYVLDIETGRWTSTATLREIFGIDETYVADVAGWVGLIPDADREPMRRYLTEHVIAGKQRFDREYRIIRHNDQQPRWVHGNGELECDATGKPVRMIGTIQDITERKRVEAAQLASEEKYRRLAEEINDVIWELDADLRVTYISPAVEPLIGYTPNEVLGRSVLEWFDAEGGRRLQQLVAESEAKGERHVTLFDEALRRKGGGSVWTEISAQRITDQNRQFNGYRGIIRDVSARKKIEDELRDSQAHLSYERDLLEALLNASPDAIYFKDLQSRMVRISRSKALRVVSCAPQLKARYDADPTVDPLTLVLGTTDFDTYAPEDAQVAYDDEQKIIRTGMPLVNKMERQVFHDGTIAWHLTNKMPWRDSNGNIIGTFGVSKDITSLKRAEADLEKVHKQLVDASRQAGMAEVATGVLHNVGNALNSVNVSASLVLDEVRASRAPYVSRVAALLEEHANDLPKYLAEDSKGQKLPAYLAALGQTLEHEQKVMTAELEELRHNVEHIKEIVAMQQTYARVAGVIEPVSIVDLVEDAIRMNSAALSRHEINLVREFATRPTITTDRHKVVQILVNLLRNAKYACDESGRSDKRITVTVAANAERYAITVRDNGVGIPPENLVRIFSHGFTTRKGGHGFGLHSGAIAARELGGALTVESAGPGTGATFTLVLPRERPPS